MIRLFLILFLFTSPVLAHRLQVDAMADAFESDDFAYVLDKLMTGKIAVVYYQWATREEESHTDWFLIDSREAAYRFAAMLRGIERAGEGWETNHARMFEISLGLLETSPYDGL